MGCEVVVESHSQVYFVRGQKEAAGTRQLQPTLAELPGLRHPLGYGHGGEEESLGLGQVKCLLSCDAE